MLNTKEEETGVSEVVEITFDRDDKQPPAIEPSEDTIANETGIESMDRSSWAHYNDGSQQHFR